MEYKISRHRNLGIINPIPDGKLAGMLLKMMSYKKQGAEFMPNPMWAIVRLYNVKKGTFPWGFRNLVDRIFKEWERQTVSGDSHEFTTTKVEVLYSLLGTCLRPYQIEAVQALVENNGGILSIPTGGGKTLTCIEYLKIFEEPTTIIATTLDIKKMWEKKCSGLKYVTVINYQNKFAKEAVANSDIVVFDECHHCSAKSLYNLAMYCKTGATLIGLSATV